MARGLNHAGSFDGSAQRDIMDVYAPAAPFTTVSASKTLKVKHGSYLCTGSAVTLTIPAPVSGADDGVTIMLTAGSDAAHKFTCTGKINTPSSGTESGSVAVAAYTGNHVCLRAWGGYWHVLLSNGTLSFS